MQCVLNFSMEEKKAILLFLHGFQSQKTNTAYELFRCRIGKSTVTFYSSGKLVVQGNDCQTVKEKILNAVSFEDKAILGIDEVGRGEASGPFVIAAVLARPSKMRELRDSKKVRDLDKKLAVVQQNALAISVFSMPSKNLVELHEKGISLNDIEVAAINCWHDFFRGIDKKLEIWMDGTKLKGCKKGVSFLVKGDDLNPVIGAASVVAKSTRKKSKDRGKRLGWGSWQRKGR